MAPLKVALHCFLITLLNQPSDSEARLINSAAAVEQEVVEEAAAEAVVAAAGAFSAAAAAVAIVMAVQEDDGLLQMNESSRQPYGTAPLFIFI